MAEKKKQPPQVGRLVDTWVGRKPKPSFENWLRAFRRSHRARWPFGREASGDRVEPISGVDPVSAYRYERLTSHERIRFNSFLRELALLGYDLDSVSGVDKFWRLSQAERDRLYYIVQDPERFKIRIRERYFDNFREHFKDFQKRFSEFFEHLKEVEPSFDPEDLAAHYRFLGLSPTASQAEIRERYRQLSFRYHPDTGGDETRMKALNIAYAAALRDAKERASARD